MQTTQTAYETLNISREKLVSFVGQSFGGQDFPNPEDTNPPGPWDPYIHRALDGLRAQLERQRLFPHEEAWRTLLTLGVFSGREEIFDALIPHSLAELNPQPLPPRARLLAAVTQQVVDRVLLIQETADTINQTGNEQGIIIVGGKISKFVDEIDELCPRLPRKFPKPKGGSEDRFSALELLAAGAIFEQNAATIAHEGLRNELKNAGAKLIETGIARM